MTIEVKQIIIKSTVMNTRDIVDDHEVPAVDLEQFKAALLEECRELISDSLNGMRER